MQEKTHIIMSALFDRHNFEVSNDDLKYFLFCDTKIQFNNVSLEHRQELKLVSPVDKD